MGFRRLRDRATGFVWGPSDPEALSTLKLRQGKHVV